MPSPWTFSIPPIKDFVERWLVGRKSICDPFCGQSTYGTVTNDLGRGGIDAVEFLEELVRNRQTFDAILFDPPYSPRQMSEVYKSVGMNMGIAGSQSARLYSECAKRMKMLVGPGGVVLRFGWNSCGLGEGFQLAELLTVCHGGAHNDTICCAWVKNEAWF